MTDESDHPHMAGSASGRRDHQGPSPPVQGSPHTVAVVVNKLRDAGLACEVVYLEPVKAAVLKRDRIIVILALALLTASA
jgi:hypothetical protein